MNSKITTINIMFSLTISMVAFAQPSSAGEVARFNFAPSRYKLEEAPEIPRSDPSHAVKNGNVAAGHNFLGLSPEMLKKAPPVQIAAPLAAPPVAPTVAPMVTQNNVDGTMNKAPISPLFGKPGALKVASSPTGIPAKALAMHPSSHTGAQNHYDKDVHGRITSRTHKKPAESNGLLAKGGGLDSYGKDFGYVPGRFIPSASSEGGTSTDTNVTGRLLSR